MDLKTPLYDEHVRAGGKMVSFGGYLLPVQYSSVLEEHNAVRRCAGLFDVSQMGEVLFEGSDALKNINMLFSNDYTSMKPGSVRYGVMLYENGCAVDDLIVYKFSDEKYYVVVNAANRHKDAAWIKEHIFGDVKFTDISDSVAQLALQGKCSEKILEKLTDKSNIPEKYYTFKQACVGEIDCMLSRTGYTGDYGFELYIRPEDAPKMWRLLMDAGEEFGIKPCGLGARDTLRLEASMPLYGHELSENITPLEAGLSFAVKMNKPDFVGKQGLLDRGEASVCRIGLKITGRGIAREHFDVYSGDTLIGKTTSGTFLPYLGGAYAMAMVKKEYSTEGGELFVDIRGRKTSAEVVPLPFFKLS